MTVMAPDVDPALYTDPTSCQTLWAHVLTQLIKDAQAYWRDGYGPPLELEQAFDDVMRCGPMTRHVCEWLEIEPVKVSERFIRWCESEAG